MLNAFEEAQADLMSRNTPKKVAERHMPKVKRTTSIDVWEWLLLHNPSERDVISNHFNLKKNVISAMLAHLTLHNKIKAHKEFSYVANKDVQFYTAIMSPDGVQNED